MNERVIVWISWALSTVAVWWITADVAAAAAAGFSFGVTALMAYSFGRMHGRDEGPRP